MQKLNEVTLHHFQLRQHITSLSLSLSKHSLAVLTFHWKLLGKLPDVFSTHATMVCHSLCSHEEIAFHFWFQFLACTDCHCPLRLHTRSASCVTADFVQFLVLVGILSTLMAASLMAHGPSSGLAWQTLEIPMSLWSMPGISQNLSRPPLSVPLSSPSQLLQNPEWIPSWASLLCLRELSISAVI